MGFFIGPIEFEPFHRIWKTWAPRKTKFLCGCSHKGRFGQQIGCRKEA
jgi:hypothetical protein